MAESKTSDAPVVLVTGVSGFVGLHVAKICLDAGFRVRGTTRSTKNEERNAAMKFVSPGAKLELELVELDLMDEAAWHGVVKGCQFIMHVASPFVMGGKEEELVPTAVNGTLNVLKAAAATNGAAKRVVVTSSIAAIAYGHDYDSGYEFSEDDWSNPENVNPYIKSKICAERAAWDFVGKLEAAKKFELATVNPMFILGPPLMKQGGVSVNFMHGFFNGEHKILPDARFGVVDVRDVAQAHLLAMTKPEAAGKRFLCCKKSSGFREVAGLVREEFTQYGYSIAKYNAPKALIWVASFFSGQAAEVLNTIGKGKVYNNKRATALGVNFRPIKETVVDACYQLINLGMAEDKTNGVAATRAKAAVKAKVDPSTSSSTVPESDDTKPATADGASLSRATAGAGGAGAGGSARPQLRAP